MDGHSLGKAMSGVAMMAGFGIVCAAILYAFAPGFIFIGALQIGARLAVGTWYPLPGYWQVYGVLTGLWLLGNAGVIGAIHWAERRRQRRLAAKHEDFMRLRKLFYRDNEVCLDSYEALKRRAGEA